MIFSSKCKNKLPWLILIVVSFCIGLYIFNSSKEIKNIDINSEANKNISKKEDVKTIKIKLPQTENFYIELEKTKLGNNTERYFSDFRENTDGLITRGTVVLLNDIFIEESGYKIMPMAVNFGGSGEFFYLVLFDKDFNHLDSMFVDADIDIVEFEKGIDGFVFKYKSHHFSQARSENPIVDTELNFIVKDEILVQEEKYLNSSDVIYLLGNSVHSNSEVTGKFDLSFMAKGWLFENTSTAKLFSEKMEELDQAIASSKSGEWMTSDYVEISTTLDPGDYKGKAKVILISDNASGLPKHDKSLEFWIYIK